MLSVPHIITNINSKYHRQMYVKSKRVKLLLENIKIFFLGKKSNFQKLQNVQSREKQT